MADDWILWFIIIGYVGFIFVKGVSKARKIGDADDYLVAGRNVGWFMLACTMGATVIGGGCSVGAIGKTYEWGLLMLLVSTGWYLHFIFSGLFVAPKFRKAKLYTVAGYFGHRFGERPRFVVMVLSVLFSVFIVAAQMAAFGTVVSAILPQSVQGDFAMIASIAIGGLLVVTYSTAGGLLAVIHTDVFQFLILVGGLLVTMLFCMPDVVGSWGQPEQTIPDTFLQLDGGKGWVFAITTFLAFFLGETFAPGYATRYCVGRTIRDTKLGIAGVGVFLALIFPGILFFIAYYARLHFPDADAQQALPLVVTQLNNPVIGGLIIAALLMAVMSSADSALNSATAIFVKDLFEHQLGWTEEPSGRTLRLARICTAALGVTSVVIAILWPDIIGLLLFTYHLWAPAIILPVCVGVFSKDHSPRLGREILVTMLAAITLTLGYRWSPWSESVDPAVVGVTVSLVVFGLMRAFHTLAGTSKH